MKKPVKVLAVTSLLASLTVSGVANAAVDPFAGTPSTEAPTTEAPTTEAPSTEAPTTEAPSTVATTSETSNTRQPATPEADADKRITVKVLQGNDATKTFDYGTDLVKSGQSYTYQQIADLVGYKGELLSPNTVYTVPDEVFGGPYTIELKASEISKSNEFESIEYSRVSVVAGDYNLGPVKLEVGKSYTHQQLLNMFYKVLDPSEVAVNPDSIYVVPATPDTINIPVMEKDDKFELRVIYTNKTTHESHTNTFDFYKGTKVTYQDIANFEGLKDIQLDNPNESVVVDGAKEVSISYVETAPKEYVDYNYYFDGYTIYDSRPIGTLAPFFVGYELFEEIVTNSPLYGNDYYYKDAPGSRLGLDTTEAPTTEAPTTEAPTTEAPTTEAPTTEAPTTEAPTTEAPTTEAPTTEAPTTEAPTTEVPSTEAPTVEEATTELPTVEDNTNEESTTENSTVESKTTEDVTSEDKATEDNKDDVVLLNNIDKNDKTIIGSSSDNKENGSNAKEEHKLESKAESKSESKSVLSSVLPQTGEAATGLIALASGLLFAAGSYLVFRKK
ncbi:LPXTG cell wall anchor domain-containing protein [Macrococcoides canis]|uniref:LPXTG cell wall anchor domain-containing protein n=1 Tax=Macrococcoides canis TaxID=1855823 RepID=UPI001AEBC48A|nr:LPXTG cell wall anchor domain-containing protein [Macrococcus canis]QTQ07602.1 LPXTG cell wall anchor domain-containing protein [Macrococcus canis]